MAIKLIYNGTELSQGTWANALPVNVMVGLESAVFSPLLVADTGKKYVGDYTLSLYGDDPVNPRYNLSADGSTWAGWGNSLALTGVTINQLGLPIYVKKRAFSGDTSSSTHAQIVVPQPILVDDTNPLVGQTAATVIASGGTASIVATVISVASANATQVAGLVTATGGTQLSADGSITNGTLTQLSATVTATGGVQSTIAARLAAAAQSGASVIATGGTQLSAGNVVGGSYLLDSTGEQNGTAITATNRPIYIEVVATAPYADTGETRLYIGLGNGATYNNSSYLLWPVVGFDEENGWSFEDNVATGYNSGGTMLYQIQGLSGTVQGQSKTYRVEITATQVIYKVNGVVKYTANNTVNTTFSKVWVLNNILGTTPGFTVGSVKVGVL